MWSCPKCLCENSDSASICRHCNAPRTHRHFQPPTVHEAAPQPVRAPERPEGLRQGRSAPRNRQAEWAPPPLSRSSRLLRFCGGILSFTLPALCLLLAFKQFDTLYPVLVPLLTGSAEITPLGLMCYGLYTLCALLLSLLPGFAALSATGKYQRANTRNDAHLL